MAMDIEQWLVGLGLGQYAAAFKANEVDAATLPHLTADDLKELGVAAVGHRRRLLDALAALAAPMQPAASPPASPPPAEAMGEWRRVAVLFADLAGYTALGQALGAEATHALLGRFFALADGLVEAHGGRVDKHIGDCVMAVFGAPVAHGNDAERALATALAIKAAMPALAAELGRPLDVHLGLAEGRVVASPTGSASHQEYTVTGDTVNLAARLAAAAAAGEILVADDMWQGLAARLAGQDAGRLRLKGFAQPVRAWRLEGLSEPRTPAAAAPLVGRQAELAGLEALLAASRDTGRGRIVLLRGEAGIGKTRLVEELQHRARLAGVACHATHVLDFGAGTGRDAVRALARSLAGPAPAGLAPTAPVNAAEADLPFLNDLLDLPQPAALLARYAAMESPAREAGLRRVAATLAAGAAREQPLLLVVEDVHWADPTTLGRLAALAAAVADCPALLLLTSRLEGDPIDPGWRSACGETPIATLDIGRLSRAEATTLAGSLLAGAAGLAERCVERAAGNPLFLEQLLRHAHEMVEAGVPATVQSLVQARLDRLAGADRAALQAASVLGQRFAADALAALRGDPGYRPDRLLAQHLLRPEGDGFLFAHALIRDGVYDTLLTTRRRELHRLAAGWFADRDPALEAEHLDRAEAPEAAAACLRAARLLAGQFRLDGARRLLARGLELATDRRLRFELACQSGELEHDAGAMPAALAAYETAAALAESCAERCHALIGLATVKRVTDDLAAALADLDAAAADADGLVAEQARIHFLRGNLLFPRGDIEGVEREHRLSLELARACGSAELEAAALGGLGDAAYMRGRLVGANGHFRACVEVATLSGFARIEVANRPMLAWTGRFVHDSRSALAEAQAAIAAARRIGQRRGEMIAHHAAYVCRADLGDLAEAGHHVERALALARELKAPRFEAEGLAFGAELALAGGRPEAAREAIDSAIAIARQSGMAFMGPVYLGILARLEPDASARAAALVEAEALLAAGSACHNHLIFRRDAIEACLERGDWAEALRFAADLDSYTAAEPLPWATFHTARARALATRSANGPAAGQGSDADLVRLTAEARRLGLLASLPAIERACPG